MNVLPINAKPTLDDLKQRLAILTQHRIEAQKNENLVRAEILNQMQDQINAALKEKEEPFGSVNLDDDLSINIPKKVKWDQNGLRQLWDDIGETAFEYIEVEFGVKESKFKAWPSDIKNSFMPFRTVTPGAATIKLKGDENA